jgi:broad specificity phosphatase PhoE
MRIYASPLRRAAFLAALIAREAGCAPIVDVRLAERNFGAWERRPWSDIYAESGDAMMGMLTAPSTFRPGGGETTEEVRDRVLRWHAALPPSGRVIVVSHGGPIAALVGTARGLAPVDWAPLIPPCGGMVEV